VPSVSRFHCVVERTVPLTRSPTTPQTRFTLAPLTSEPLIGAEVDGAARRLTRPSALRTLPVLYAVVAGLAFTGSACGEAVVEQRATALLARTYAYGM
jgi:hypothetical protein